MGFFSRKKKTTEQRNQVATQRRSFAAAAVNDLLSSWVTETKRLDADLKAGLRPLRARARDAAQNNDYAARYLNLLKINIPGNGGIKLQSKVTNDNGTQDAGANKVIEDAWARWSKKGNCDVTGRMSRVDCEHLFIETAARDGEVLVRKVKGFDNGFGFALQFLDVDHLDEQHNGKAPNGNLVRMGIELDRFERPTAYWLMVAGEGQDTYYTGGRHRVRIPADEMIHAFRSTRPHQTRGYSWMASALIHMHHLGQFEKAALIAAQVGASTMGFFTRSPDGDGYGGDDVQSDGTVIDKVEPGLLKELPYGVDFRQFDTKYPNEVFDPFVKRALKAIASGLNVSYPSLASDISDVNFSSIRAGTIDERDNWRTLQQWMIGSFHERFFADWLRMALLTGLGLPVSKFDKFNAPTWQPRGWQWVDPQKDINALKIAEEMQTTSLSQIVAEQGRDLEDVLRQRQIDNKLLEKYGLMPTEVSDARE